MMLQLQGNKAAHYQHGFLLCVVPNLHQVRLNREFIRNPMRISFVISSLYFRALCTLPFYVIADILLLQST